MPSASRLLLFLITHLIRLAPTGVLRKGLRKWGFQVASNMPLRSLADPGDVVVQAGCWMIETAVEWARAVGRDGKVIVIEADNVNAEILRIEVVRRQLHNVQVVERALWSRKEGLTLQTSDLSMRNKVKEAQTFSYILKDQDYQEEKQVLADSLDNILSDLGIHEVDHIHLTVSGAELEALEGMSGTLRQNGVRVYARSTLLHENDGKPVNLKVANMLRGSGFNAVCARPEPGRLGGNVYAWKH